MGAGVWEPVEREEPAVPVIATETPRAVPDRERTVDVAAHGDAQPGAGPPARLLGDLQRQLGEGDTSSWPTVRSSCSQRIVSRSTPWSGTKALVGSAGGCVNSSL